MGANARALVPIMAVALLKEDGLKPTTRQAPLQEGIFHRPGRCFTDCSVMGASGRFRKVSSVSVHTGEAPNWLPCGHWHARSCSPRGADPPLPLTGASPAGTGVLGALPRVEL